MKKTSQDIQLVVSWLPALCQRIFFFQLPLPSLFVRPTHSLSFISAVLEVGSTREKILFINISFFGAHVFSCGVFLPCLSLGSGPEELADPPAQLLVCFFCSQPARQAGKGGGRVAGGRGFPSLPCFLMRPELTVSLSSFIIPPTVEVRYTSGFKHSVKKSLLCALVLTPTQRWV